MKLLIELATGNSDRWDLLGIEKGSSDDFYITIDRRGSTGEHIGVNVSKDVLQGIVKAFELN